MRMSLTRCVTTSAGRTETQEDMRKQIKSREQDRCQKRERDGDTRMSTPRRDPCHVKSSFVIESGVSVGLQWLDASGDDVSSDFIPGQPLFMQTFDNVREGLKGGSQRRSKGPAVLANGVVLGHNKNRVKFFKLVNSEIW